MGCYGMSYALVPRKIIDLNQENWAAFDRLSFYEYSSAAQSQPELFCFDIIYIS